ncbi:MAG: hypothetical protein ACFB51_12175 [Anaerolineae bacterium]
MSVQANQRENLTPLQRALESLIILAMLFVFGFFAAHQRMDTGFFTGEFGPFAMVCLYGPILAAMVPPIIRIVTGRRHPSLPLEAAANSLLALGSLWLVIVFPFDYAHLADVLPQSLQFVLGWITDGIGRFVLILQVIIGPISAVTALGQYLTQQTNEPGLNRRFS